MTRFASGRRRRLRLAALAVLLAAAAGTACGRGQDPPTPVSTRPARILSLAPSVTEIVFALGAGDRVVGVDDFSTFPAAARALPRVGGLLDPDVEGMLALRPDLAILLPAQVETARALAAAGVPTLVVPHERLGDVEVAVRAIGRRIGHAAVGDSLASVIRRGLARDAHALPAGPRPRVLFVVSREPGQVASLTAAGGGSFLDELIELAGGRNVLRDSPVRYPQLSAEGLLRLRPDIVLEWWPAPRQPDLDRRWVEEWRRLPHVPAVAAGRVHVLHDDLWLRPGPRVVEALDRLEALFGTGRAARPR